MLKKLNNWFCKIEKLTIKLDYNEETGLSLIELSNYLLGISDSYSTFTNKKSNLTIKNISKGSVILEFSQQVLVPTLIGVYSNGIYDFGKMLIQSVRTTKNIEQTLSKIKEKDTDTIKNAKTALAVGGANVGSVDNTGASIGTQTITTINVVVSMGNETDSETISSENKNQLSTIRNSLDQVHNQLLQEKKKINSYESVILKFKTITVPNTDKCSYTGWITDIHKDPKKIDFDENVKSTFLFSNFDFNQEFLVDVNVYYNANNSIAKYVIIENLGEN